MGLTPQSIRQRLPRTERQYYPLATAYGTIRHTTVSAVGALWLLARSRAVDAPDMHHWMVTRVLPMLREEYRRAMAAPERDVRAFCFDGHDIRVVMQRDTPWFVAKDVFAALGLVDNRTHLAKLRPTEKGVNRIDTPGGTQAVSMVNEHGLYRLIFRSDKPSAHAFQDWVFTEVLPAIHRTGRYEHQRLTALEKTVARLEHGAQSQPSLDV